MHSRTMIKSVFHILLLGLCLMGFNAHAQEAAPGGACSTNGVLLMSGGVGQANSHILVCVSGTWASVLEVNNTTADANLQNLDLSTCDDGEDVIYNSTTGKLTCVDGAAAVTLSGGVLASSCNGQYCFGNSMTADKVCADKGLGGASGFTTTGNQGTYTWGGSSWNYNGNNPYIDTLSCTSATFTDSLDISVLQSACNGQYCYGSSVTADQVCQESGFGGAASFTTTGNQGTYTWGGSSWNYNGTNPYINVLQCTNILGQNTLTASILATSCNDQYCFGNKETADKVCADKGASGALSFTTTGNQGTYTWGGSSWNYNGTNPYMNSLVCGIGVSSESAGGSYSISKEGLIDYLSNYSTKTSCYISYGLTQSGDTSGGNTNLTSACGSVNTEIERMACYIGYGLTQSGNTSGGSTNFSSSCGSVSTENERIACYIGYGLTQSGNTSGGSTNFSSSCGSVSTDNERKACYVGYGLAQSGADTGGNTNLTSTCGSP